MPISTHHGSNEERIDQKTRQGALEVEETGEARKGKFHGGTFWSPQDSFDTEVETLKNEEQKRGAT